MGFGEHNLESGMNPAEEFLQPNGNKDPEKSTCIQEQDCFKSPNNNNNNTNNHVDYKRKKGIAWKLRSLKVSVIYVIAQGAAILILITVIILLSVREKEKNTCVHCEDEWIPYRGKCYFFSESFETWPKSQDYCKQHNSSLTTIDNKEELDLLNRHKSDDNHWIGLSRKEGTSGWIWTNGTTFSEDLFFIQRQHMNPGDLERAYLNHDGVKSGSENIHKKWICSKDLFFPANR
ncbi:C-type lectin domain family 2 member A-like [Aquarana catesbeiana]|uniref:C-type lectin domain family 2 member A-like n=1 Tax=Aquarana catesbeiana TaxID=8400 RepID=UPI003CC9D7C7